MNAQTTWFFLIKVPYLGKLCVIYDTENKGFSHFSSDENKGLKSIAEIRCSALKPLITDGMASIRLVPHVEATFTHAPRAFVWLLDLYGGSFVLYLPIPLENELYKISQTWVGAF